METVEKGGISNQIEAKLVHAIVCLLLKVGLIEINCVFFFFFHSLYEYIL